MKKNTAVVVNATDIEYITAINPIVKQIKDLDLSGNIGFYSCPNMQSKLKKFKGPKNNNL